MTLGIDVERSQWSEPFLNAAFNCGFDNIVDARHADILVKTASAITQEDLNNGQKIIALEKTSGGNIAYRELLKHSSVIRYVKSFNYYPFEQHNRPCVDGRLFTSLLGYKGWQTTPITPINETDYSKISLGWSILHYSRLSKLLSREYTSYTESINNRPIDIFFAGTLDYDNSDGMRKSGDIISSHRKKCVECLESLSEYKTYIVKGKHLSLDDYNALLYRSKIVVSPWGWGEPCYRDYEAVIAGCILLKPKSDFIKSVCKIYEEDYCTWTDPDFSSLANDIKIAIQIFEDTKEERLIRRERLIDSREDIGKLIKTILSLPH